MGRKINPNSKRQLRLKIKGLKDDKNTLWDMVTRRNKTLADHGISIGVTQDEFLTGNEEGMVGLQCLR